jgi:hypothetical protein
MVIIAHGATAKIQPPSGKGSSMINTTETTNTYRLGS